MPAPSGYDWIRPLAAPYLRGFHPLAQRRGSLRGYWFLHPDSTRPPAAESSKAQGRETSAGFFLGYLVAERGFEFLKPGPPECLVFVFVSPVGSKAHRRLVADNGSLVRRTFDYIRLLTHRPPRFVIHAGQAAAMLRYQSMRDWPAAMRPHFSKNFFIESLAWLVRSAIVRRLRVESFAARKPERVASGVRKSGADKLRPQRKSQR